MSVKEEDECRPVLGPAGNNKTRSVQKVSIKSKDKTTSSPPPSQLQLQLQLELELVGVRRNKGRAASILTSSLSNASCSSDASSTDSTRSRASTGRISRRNGNGIVTSVRRKTTQCRPKFDTRIDVDGNEGGVDDVGCKKRCSWVTSTTDPLYTAFHDEEWGIPVHDDKKLFELLSFSTALAELSWPIILSKRHIFREVFLDFDPVAVSKLNEKKVSSTGSTASSLLSEVKLRAIIENARQICRIIIELGSFDKYIWAFVNDKPTVGSFRYPRQVPIKTSKADTISKDLVRRGFRGVGPTVVYSFMQAAGITNDHLINCFRYRDCVDAGNLCVNKNEAIQMKNEVGQLELSRDIDDLNLIG